MEFKVDMRGMSQLKSRVRRLADKARAPDGEHSVSLSELCPPGFMARFTDFRTLEEMFDASGFTVEIPEDFAAIPDSEWDALVTNVTRFPDWQVMQQRAAAEWARRRLGLGEGWNSSSIATLGEHGFYP